MNPDSGPVHSNAGGLHPCLGECRCRQHRHEIKRSGVDGIQGSPCVCYWRKIYNRMKVEAARKLGHDRNLKRNYALLEKALRPL